MINGVKTIFYKLKELCCHFYSSSGIKYKQNGVFDGSQEN